MKKFILFVLFCFSIHLVEASVDWMQTWKPVVPNKVQEKFTSSSLLQLNGLLNDRILINLEKRLLWIDSTIILSGFVHRPGPQTWIGEHMGKFLFSASNTYLYTHDPRIKGLMDRMLPVYISSQLSDGYLGTYLPNDYWTQWDVWAHKYAIIGLLNYYSITGYQPALQAAINVADLICRTFGDDPGKRDLNKSGSHVGMAAGSILDPMIDLYRFTGDQKYLTFAKYILRNWESATGPKIISGLDQFGKVTKVGNGKAYEMMSCFVGILKYYKLTGDAQYLKLMQTAWQDIVDHRLFITGTTSKGEFFPDDNSLRAEIKDHIGEGCVTMTWMQFNEQLLKITGELKYAEEIERAVYNHLFAAENPVTGCVSYYTPMQGAKPYSCKQYSHCCLSSVPMGISSIPGLVWGTINKEFTLLMYEPGEVRDSILASDGSELLVQVKSVTDFPANGEVVFTINPSSSKKFAINFRIPSWSANYTLAVNSEKQKRFSDQLIRVERVWKPDDKVMVNFELPLQIIKGGASYPDYIAFKRGPQVLALDSLLNPQFKDGSPLHITAKTKFVINEATQVLSDKWIGKQVYRISFDTSKEQQNLILVPFADAGQLSNRQQVWNFNEHSNNQ